MGTFYLLCYGIFGLSDVYITPNVADNTEMRKKYLGLILQYRKPTAVNFHFTYT